MINPDIGTDNRKRDIILRIRRIESKITGKGDVTNITSFRASISSTWSTRILQLPTKM